MSSAIQSTPFDAVNNMEAADPSIISEEEISMVKIHLPLEIESEIGYATLQLKDNIVRKFFAKVKFVFKNPLETKWGKKAVVEFQPSVRQHFEVLLNRVAIMQNIDPKAINNPVGVNNRAYVKLGKKYVQPEQQELGADVSFGIYIRREGGIGFFLRLE